MSRVSATIVGSADGGAAGGTVGGAAGVLVGVDESAAVARRSSGGRAKRRMTRTNMLRAHGKCHTRGT